MDEYAKKTYGDVHANMSDVDSWSSACSPVVVVVVPGNG